MIFDENLQDVDPVVLQDVAESHESIQDSRLEPITLITGSTGMIGSYLAEFYIGMLMQSGVDFQIVLCARKFDSNSERLRVLGNGKVKLVLNDQLSNYLETNQLSKHIIHAASPASVNNYLDDPLSLVETNLTLTTMLCEHLKKVGGHFTFMSSGEVYGHSPTIPTQENFEGLLSHLDESFSYAEAKRAAEFILKSYSTLNIFKVSIFRVYHAFGPGIRSTDTRIFATAINSVVGGLDVVLRSDGKATRGFLYMGDVARAVLKKNHIKNFSVFNLCGSKEISIYDFAKMACDLSDGKSKVSFSGVKQVDEASNNKVKRGFADTSLIRSTGWTQRITVEEGIARSIRSGKWRRKQI